MIVIPLLIQQIFVPALFDDLSVPHHKDQIRVADGGKTVGNDKGCTAMEQFFCGLLDELFRLGIDGGCGFIQDKDGRIGNNGSGKGNKLFFSGGEAAAAFTNIGLIAFFQLGHNLVGGYGFGRSADFFIGGVQAAVTDIFFNGPGKQMGTLKHIADIAVEPKLAPLPVVLSVNKDPSAGWLKETAGQVDQGAFSGAGFSDNGYSRSCGNLQVKVAEDFLRAVGVVEGYILKINIPFNGFPIFFFRVKGVSVFFNNFRRIGNCRLPDPAES